MNSHDSPHPGNQPALAGFYALICAIIEQAVTDYRFAVERGWIAGGQLTPAGLQLRAANAFSLTTADLRQLLTFLSGPDLDHLCEFLRIDIDPDAIRSRLGIPDNPQHKAQGS